jgi:hypothetical protein
MDDDDLFVGDDTVDEDEDVDVNADVLLDGRGDRVLIFTGLILPIDVRIVDDDVPEDAVDGEAAAVDGLPVDGDGDVGIFDVDVDGDNSLLVEGDFIALVLLLNDFLAVAAVDGRGIADARVVVDTFLGESLLSLSPSIGNVCSPTAA